jgi:hypothetical protein
MIKLHYAELTNEGDIPCLKFNNEFDFLHFLQGKSIREDIVYVFAYEFKNLDNHTEVFVTSDLSMIWVIMKNCFHDIQADNMFFLQEYPSFEDAYKVALDMQETSNLCYNEINL